MDTWKYVKKDGNPDKRGIYTCVLVFDEINELGHPTGRKFAEVGERYFGKAKKDSDWIMNDQPHDGKSLVWQEECGSSPNESVWAWLPLAEQINVDLPDGVEWFDMTE